MTDPPQCNPLVAMVALKTPSLADVAGALTPFHKMYPDWNVLDSLKQSGETVVFPLGENMAAISLIPAPIPWNDLEGPCATAWWWPQATERMKLHDGHLVVAMMGDSGDAVQRHVWLTHLVSSIVGGTDAIGIYWASGTLVHEAEAFREQVAQLSLDHLQPQLWVDLRLEENEDGSLRFFTTGMQSFDRREIEIDQTGRKPQEILEFCHSIVGHILTSNPELEDGETIGRSDDEKIEITLQPSMWDPKVEVMKLAFA